MSDERIATLRWLEVNKAPKAHLWLGDRTACQRWVGDAAWSLDVSRPAERCRQCEAYARGWLDHHDTGDSPGFDHGRPNPRAHNTRLERAS